MELMRIFLSRCAAIFQERKLDDELDEELRSHIDFAAEEHLKNGMTAQQTRAAALLAFGGVTQTKEAYRLRGDCLGSNKPAGTCAKAFASFGGRRVSHSPQF